MRTKALKVGEVARRTGITARTLHHYDEIGLLQPSEQTEAGHRLYTEDDIAVLQKIVSLRQLGFSLDQIGKVLREPDRTLPQVLDLHLAEVRKHVAQAQSLCRTLESMT